MCQKDASKLTRTFGPTSTYVHSHDRFSTFCSEAFFAVSFIHEAPASYADLPIFAVRVELGYVYRLIAPEVA